MGFYQLMMRNKGGSPTPPIPSRYQVVDYIQNPTKYNTNTADCYIDTYITPNINNVIYYKATFNIANPISTSTSAIGTIFGSEAYNISESWRYGFTVGTYKAKTGGEANLYGTQFDPSIVPNTKMSIELNNHIYTTSNGASVTIGNYSSANYRGTIKVFCVQGNGAVNYQANMKLYEFKLGKSPTELVIDYIPVYDTIGNKYGVYNLIDDTFKSSATSTNFTGGND